MSQRSQGFLWDCWMSMSCVFLTKKSHKIHYTKESIKIYRLLNTNRQFISHEKSRLNTNGFCCLKKSHDCLNWIPQDLFTIYKSLDSIPLDFFIIKKSFKITWILNSIHPYWENLAMLRFLTKLSCISLKKKKTKLHL
jgi:hypothetical protein